MSNKEEWAKLFETVNGRKPTPQEFLAAKKTDFDTSDLKAAVKTEEVAETEVSAAADIEGVSADETIADQEDIDAVAESVEDAVAEAPQVDTPASTEPTPPAQEVPVQNEAVEPQAQVNPTAFAQAAPTASQGANPLFTLILPIVAIVLSVIFAILAWIGVPGIFIVLTLVTVGIAVASLVMSLKTDKKLLSIIATGVAGLMLFVSIGGLIYQLASNVSSDTSSVVRDADDEDEDDSDSNSKSNGDSNDVNDYIDKNAKFDWDEKKFKKLKVGEDAVKSIIKTYGKASNAEMSGDRLTLYYKGSDYNQSVDLRFEKQYDGTFVLSSGSASFTQDLVEVDRNYKSDWTKEQYDALKEGDYDNPTSGTKLDDVLKDHPKADSASSSISTYRKGEFTKSLSITYSDYDNEEGKLDYVSLSFDYVDKEDTYYLDYKFGGDD